MKLLKKSLLIVLFTMMVIIPLTGAQNSTTELNSTNHFTIDSDTKNVTNFVANNVVTKDEVSFTTSLESSQIPQSAAYFRPSTGYWYFDYNFDGVSDKSFQYGGSTDQIIKGDWTGDGKDGIAIFRPSTGYWYFDYQLDGVVDKSFRYGGSTDQIVKGDWDGDGKDSIAIFRPSTGYWYFDYNLDGVVDKFFRYGGSTDQIIIGDWTGDGKDSIAIFRPSTGYWYFDYNLDGVVDKFFRYGGSTDQILAGDWNGDGRDGIAIFRPSTGYWYFDNNLDGSVDISERFGGSGDTPIVGRWAVPSLTEYKVYAEVGESSLVDSARGFWDKIHNVQSEGITWSDSGKGVIYKTYGSTCPLPPDDLTCPRASHWTSNANQWIGQADFLYFSGHGGPELIRFDDDSMNLVTANSMRLNSTGQIKWVVLDGCSALNGDSASVWAWAPSFNNGLHMLLGWHTDVASSKDLVTSEYRGGEFANLMKGEYPGDQTHHTMFAAWWLAGVYTYQSFPGHSSFDVYNAVMYWNGCENDHLPGYGDICSNPGASGTITWNPRLVFPKNTAGSTNSIPVNLIVDNYSIVASFPVANGTSNIYKPMKSEYTKEWVSSLAKNLGMSGDVRETEDAFYTGDTDAKQYLFVVQKNASMILFRKTNSSSGIMQSDNQSITIANSFLRKNNLLPSENLEPRVVNNTALSFTSSGERIDEWKTYVVIYSQLIDGLPVFNAQFNVEVDSDGNIIGLFKNWREYSPYKEIAMKSPEDAFSEFRIISDQRLKGMPEKVNVTKVSLGYQMNPSGDMGEYLQPVYIFEGDYQRNNSIEPFEPVVIAANKDGVQQDALIPLTPSYTPEVTNPVTANFSAPITNTIIARNSTR